MDAAPTYSISRDGLADLAINRDLEQRLRDAIDIDSAIEWAVNDAITAKLAQHGVTADGEWLGTWSPAAVVTAVLEQYGLAEPLALDRIGDPQDMRALVLERLAEQAEREHARILALPDARKLPTRLAAVIAVLDEATAYWTIEQHGPMAVGDYREIAANMHRVIGKQIPSIIWQSAR